MAKKNIAKLVKKTITDKRGHRRTVWVTAAKPKKGAVTYDSMTGLLFAGDGVPFTKERIDGLAKYFDALPEQFEATVTLHDVGGNEGKVQVDRKLLAQLQEHQTKHKVVSDKDFEQGQSQSKLNYEEQNKEISENPYSIELQDKIAPTAEDKKYLKEIYDGWVKDYDADGMAITSADKTKFLKRALHQVLVEKVRGEKTKPQ